MDWAPKVIVVVHNPKGAKFAYIIYTLAPRYLYRNDSKIKVYILYEYTHTHIYIYIYSEYINIYIYIHTL